ncbi:MAG: MerC domain-containing protein [Halioglobus sp.]|jgi:hypothetical protein|nr:hypothetical protein GPB2148_2029 [marine gamma proteobacterium HTCC2148]MDG1387583.1 MerC domain-containing protein [Halioglobus sp.]MDG2327496.1 MerC domain-containing protein [Halioglobus sp.]
MRDPINILQPAADKAAIGLSLLCAVHCLLLPLSIALLPSLAVYGLADEAFHTWIILAVIPLSAFALTMGCKKHRRTDVLYIGAFGLLLLCLTPLLGHELLGEAGEKILTLSGAALIATSHIKNFRLCRSEDACACPD